MVEIFCAPVDVEPTKIMGEAGGPQAKAYITKFDGGRQAMRLYIDAGFDWKKSVAPMLPGCPEWCPATHFGYLESGKMGIQMQDGSTKTINAGETYMVPPGHLPVLTENAVMVEFSQDTTYTNDKFVKGEDK
mmetsp:Transcript_3769/g.9180  ORF Transcript_3769/g.9180 Transcript_3769/m.9180 type:complete len:132 (-) Transcript_3769:1393-1788(-)|eukprot:CAMPEP_0178993694 /NCGR_PEP_ID=MMETSP0795-20121207/6847_1 /TAXON_ID=88552 /ORGANISM="Amoebophrya sp., Strain Ameob2" /LENGTH=131 /DNA_ID=CAMNT_0020685785 /DNA_START=188 /DNA_END=583 /DNA_ORIENTATION=+